MLVKIVILYLLTANPDTGETLFQKKWEMDGFAITPDKMAYCLQEGTRMAHLLSEYYRQMYPNASTNVNCKWETVKR